MISPPSSSSGSGFVALGRRNSLVGVKIKETATSSAIYRAVQYTGQLCIYIQSKSEGSAEYGKQTVQLKQVFCVYCAIFRALHCNIQISAKNVLCS